MSSKLDQSLDEITGGRRVNARRPRRGGKPAAPVAGGVSKRTPTRPARPAPSAAATAATVPTRGDSKIIVSNLPDDVNEQQIKDYFGSTVGAVKKVLLNYTKTGKSTGVATIIFSQAGSAAQAAKDYDGVKVDGRPMKIEVILGAKFAPAPAPAKTLGERISQPKSAANKPKPVAVAGPKAQTAKSARGGGNVRGRGGRAGGAAGGRIRRPKKSAEELDAEMQDYFEPGTNGAAAAAAAPAASGAAATAPAVAAAAPNGGEAAMEDEIM